MSLRPGPVWSGPHRYLEGSGEVLAHDPGTGADRYRQALEWLRATGRGVGFASFTFDPTVRGSVVLAPEGVLGIPTMTDEGISRGLMVADGREEWSAGFDAALIALREGSVEKVVLSRQATIEFTRPVNPRTVFARLRAANPSTYSFLIEGLVGASPELLVSLDREKVSSLVLAGTSPQAEGLANAKTTIEHDLAAGSVESGLRRHTTGLVAERSVLRFGEINHMGTSFSARALPGTGVLDVLESLHPTAAVAGVPTMKALQLIRRIEPCSRDRYAGPLGWFDTEGNGEFTLALRCGLIEGDRATLYSGGGLVAGSIGEDEWAETQLKLGPMWAALGLDRPQG